MSHCIYAESSILVTGLYLRGLSPRSLSHDLLLLLAVVVSWHLDNHIFWAYPHILLFRSDVVAAHSFYSLGRVLLRQFGVLAQRSFRFARRVTLAASCDLSNVVYASGYEDMLYTACDMEKLLTGMAGKRRVVVVSGQWRREGESRSQRSYEARDTRDPCALTSLRV